MKLEKGTVTLVTDGSRLLLLRNDGDASTPALHVIEQHATPSLANGELTSEGPGVVTSSDGGRRSTYDDHDPHQRAEDEFAATAADLHSKAAETNPGDLIVVAPPTTLGVLRQHSRASAASAFGIRPD